MAIHHVDKGIAIFSLILGVLVLAICSWTFASAIYRETLISTHNDTAETDHGRMSATDSLYRSEKIEVNAAVTNIELADNKSNPTSFWIKFDEPMPNVFKGMAMGCTWIAIIGSLFQIVSSGVIIFSSSKNVHHRSKYFVAFHFLTFVTLLGALVTPLAYDREAEDFYSMTEFNTRAKLSFQTLAEEGIVKFFTIDLHAYYIILMVDSLCIFFIMIVVSCLLRFDIPKFEGSDRYS